MVRQLDADEYAQELYGRAHEDVETIFGPALARHDWNYAVDQGTGDRSLGILLVQRRADLTADESFGKPRLRLRLNDSEKPAFLSVADLRFWEADHATVKLDVVEDVRRRMRQGVETILMLLPELRAVIAMGSEAQPACREAGGAGESLSGLLLPAREALNSSMAGRAEEGGGRALGSCQRRLLCSLPMCSKRRPGCNRRELRARGSA